MKKSKVIIPAMALLLFSTAASITGTVAWFTSTRTFETSIGQFALKQLDGTLECDLAPVFGLERTSAQSSDPGYNVLRHKSNFYLTDASFNEADTKMYHKSRDAVEPTGDPTANYYEDRGVLASNAVVAKETVVGNWTYAYFASGTNQGSYLLGFVWTMTFKYTFNAESGKIGVFLNQKDSVVTKGAAAKDPAQGSSADSSKGFRIAFLEADSGLNTVYAPLAEPADDDVTNLQHVSGTSSNNVTHYTASNCLLTDDGASLVSDGATIGANVNQICTIAADGAHPETPQTKVVTCVAWYEGEDPNVVNGTAFYAPSVKLSFYSRSVVDAPQP